MTVYVTKLSSYTAVYCVKITMNALESRYSESHS